MRELVRLALRLVVIVSFFRYLLGVNWFLQSLVGQFQMADGIDLLMAVQLIPQFTFLVIPVLLMVAMWRRAPRLATRMVGQQDTSPVPPVPDHHELVAVGLVLIGVYVILTRLPDLMRQILNMFLAYTAYADFFSIAESIGPLVLEIIVTVIQIGVAAALVTRNRQLVSYIARIQEQPAREAEDDRSV